ATTTSVATIGRRIAAGQTCTALPAIATTHRDTGFNRDYGLTRTADSVSTATAVATASAAGCKRVIRRGRDRNRAGTFNLALIVLADHDAAAVVFVRMHARYAASPASTA